MVCHTQLNDAGRQVGQGCDVVRPVAVLEGTDIRIGDYPEPVGYPNRVINDTQLVLCHVLYHRKMRCNPHRRHILDQVLGITVVHYER